MIWPVGEKKALYDALTRIQHGFDPDPYGWIQNLIFIFMPMMKKLAFLKIKYF